MSLSDNYKPVKYLGNGQTKNFTFGYNMINKDYCRVFYQNKTTGIKTDKVIEKDYTLTFDDNGGTVAAKVAPTAQEYIVIYRETRQTQESDFIVGESFPAERIEDAFDKSMAAIQELQDLSNRSPKIPEGYSINITLPTPNAGKGLIWNDDENGFVNSETNIDELEQTTKGYRDEAEEAKNLAQEYKQNAEESANSSQSFAKEAEEAKNLAQEYKQNAEESAKEAQKYAIQSSYGNIGDIKYTTRTDVPNGGAWCDGAEYTQEALPDIYQMLVDGKISSTDYSTFDRSVSTNGSCGLFALDTATTSFKVPLLKDVYIKAGQAPKMFVAESSPNIEGTATTWGYLGEAWINPSTNNGPFYANESAPIKNYGESAPASNRKYGLTFDASRSSSTYQDNAKVNPDHVVYRAYVVLYTAAAEASVAQAQEFMTALGGKANVALDNVSPVQSFKDMVVGWGMPDYSAGIDVTAYSSSSKKFTAPCDGVINVVYLAQASDSACPYIGNKTFGSYNEGAVADNVTLLISKGETFYCTGMYANKGNGSNMFYPMKGVV